MTLSPVDAWHGTKPRPDLPAYDLNEWCVIHSGERGTENHHLFRRSLGPGYRDAWWVELDDGTVIPNRVMLSSEAHRRITENELRIIWISAEEGFGLTELVDEGDGGTHWTFVKYLDVPGVDRMDLPGSDDHLRDAPVVPGHDCPTCKRRVPHPKKKSTPKTKPLAYRIPIDEAEAHLEAIDAVAELLGVKEEKYHRYATISYALLAVLQGARLKERGA